MTTKQSRSAEQSEPVIEVISDILCTFNNEMGDFLAEHIAKGWEMMSPPVFSHRGEPPRFNGAAVGYRHPFFLVLLKKTKRVSPKQ